MIPGRLSELAVRLFPVAGQPLGPSRLHPSSSFPVTLFIRARCVSQLARKGSDA